MRLTGTFVLMLGIAAAQIGYPPGGSPQTYPGQTRLPGAGRGPSIPLPKRGGKDAKDSNSKKSEPTQPNPFFRGTLKRMDESEITLEMGDHRILDFKRTAKTKFFQKGGEIKTPQFRAGDQIGVEASADQFAVLTAVGVYWESEAKPDTAEKKDGAVDTWKDVEPPRPAAETAPPAPVPARPDPDDPGPPRLRRGGAADPSRQRAPEVAPAADTPQLPADRRQPVPSGATAPSDRYIPVEDLPTAAGVRPGDDYIRRAAIAAMDFTEGLPAYVCQEVIARFQSETRNPSWQALDVVTAALVYENGREEYRDIAINGKKTNKRMEESGGAWSTGEFGTVLIDLFSPATAADFRYRRDARIAGINTRVYEFSVERENSHWRVHSGSQNYSPGFKGSVWIDPQAARVMRIEMQGGGFPQAFPIDHVESATEYQYIRLGDAKQYLLPVHAETLSCQRGTNYCSKNVIDFRNYRKYSGEATITFEPVKQ